MNEKYTAEDVKSIMDYHAKAMGMIWNSILKPSTEPQPGVFLKGLEMINSKNENF